jgi:hypothetical protein
MFVEAPFAVLLLFTLILPSNILLWLHSLASCLFVLISLDFGAFLLLVFLLFFLDLFSS